MNGDKFDRIVERGLLIFIALYVAFGSGMILALIVATVTAFSAGFIWLQITAFAVTTLVVGISLVVYVIRLTKE